MLGTQEKQTLECAQSVNQSCGTRRKKLTQEELKRVLNYDPDTGIFTWKIKPNGRVKAGSIAGTNDKDGYLIIKINRRAYKAHRLAWLYMEGYFPEKLVDHKNRINNYNVWSNLRNVSHSCNSRNCKVLKNNKSGVTGVCWYKKMGKWHSQINTNGKVRHLGYYSDKTEAAKARWEAEKKYGFPNCNTTSSAYQYLQENITKPKESNNG